MRKQIRPLGRLSRIGAVGVVGTAGLIILNPVAASATATSPLWQTGQVEHIRDAGSDTTFFMIQKLSDLYEQAGLFGCTLNADLTTCNTGGDTPTTDNVDNYNRYEVYTGLDKIGSGDGIKQLCGTEASPFPVDFARSSKPPTTDCTEQGEGFAKDGVPSIDFRNIDPTGFTGSTPTIGDAAAGWRTGDATNCATQSAGTNGVNGCSGIPFTNLVNGDTTSLAYRIYCATDSTRITDWGQLTDPAHVSGGVSDGNGTPVGAPITIMGVNPTSGTKSTFDKFVLGTASGSCDSNVNAHTTGGSQDIVLENNAAQIADFLAADHPGDNAAQAEELGTVLYFMSNGVFNTNAHARTVTIGTTSEPSKEMQENSTSESAANNLSNAYPTARVLYNIIVPSTVRASTAGFINWICDKNSTFTKKTDLNTGINFDTEVTNIINNQFGFSRLADTTPAPNNTCPLITSVGDPNS